MIILSKGKLDLHNNIVDTFVERHATTRIKNNTLTEDTVKFFVFFLLHESTFPISCMILYRDLENLLVFLFHLQ